MLAAILQGWSRASPKNSSTLNVARWAKRIMRPRYILTEAAYLLLGVSPVGSAPIAAGLIRMAYAAKRAASALMAFWSAAMISASVRTPPTEALSSDHAAGGSKRSDDMAFRTRICSMSLSGMPAAAAAQCCSFAYCHTPPWRKYVFYLPKMILSASNSSTNSFNRSANSGWARVILAFGCCQRCPLTCCRKPTRGGAAPKGTQRQNKAR